MEGGEDDRKGGGLRKEGGMERGRRRRERESGEDDRKGGGLRREGGR